MSIQKFADLYFQDTSVNSDKEYHLRLVRNGTPGIGWTVQFSYGRRGAHLTEGVKGSFATFMEADRVYCKVEREKLAEGYHLNRTVALHTTNPQGLEETLRVERMALPSDRLAELRERARRHAARMAAERRGDFGPDPINHNQIEEAARSINQQAAAIQSARASKVESLSINSSRRRVIWTPKEVA